MLDQIEKMCEEYLRQYGKKPKHIYTGQQEFAALACEIKSNYGIEQKIELAISLLTGLNVHKTHDLELLRISENKQEFGRHYRHKLPRDEGSIAVQ